jgi:hypothetical protein
MQDASQRQTYFENMSRSVAMLSDVFATVMDPTPASPRVDGIWGRVEFPQLTGNLDNYGVVSQIEGINGDASDVQQVWVRQSGGKRDLDATERFDVSLLTRDTCGIVGDDIAGDFDDGGEFAVDW